MYPAQDQDPGNTLSLVWARITAKGGYLIILGIRNEESISAFIFYLVNELNMIVFILCTLTIMRNLDMMTRFMRHGCVHQMMSARARAYTNKLPRWPPQDDDLHNLSTANAFQISQSPLNPHKVSIIF